MQQNSRHRVLIAEDTESIRHMVMLALHGEPYEVVLVTDGTEAVRAYRAAREAGKPFDLLVLDIIMLNVSGLKVAEDIRKAGDDETPIVLWTAADSPLVEMRSSSANINGIWEKCEVPAALAKNIRRMLGLPPTDAAGEGT